MKNSILKTRNLCKVYVTEGTNHNVIKNLDIEIYKEDFTVIMGSSGSGKSTLLYLLSGLDNCSAGEIYFNYTRIDKMKEKEIAMFRRKNIGFVFQGINLVPNLTLLENITIAGYLLPGNRHEVDEKAKELFKLVDLENEMDRLPSQVSGGQQQRAAIVRSLINSPEILFADEPTGSLNSSQSKNVLDIFTKINSKKQTVVMVTHDIKAATRANRVIFIKDGKINGEMNLTKFTKENATFTEEKIAQREEEIFAFLKEKDW